MQKNEFIWNDSNTTLVNTAHIVTMGISVPMYEQKDYRVYATLSFGNGSVCLHRGTEESCKAYMGDFYYFH